ncbi:hypothetical protein [Rhizorhapis sp.]|uniref:hypothetical protein n=1 Tax=Rhizorhapis sp. TaxID=1968842 RepID=UPI002B4A468D|nr:hypothetical protein [Rhizorhapis sp.]HKR16508.1 hypothetical protein [Rhizorhapis sp.]
MHKGRKYSRDEAARFLRANGLRTTAASLATMATRGGSPPYFKIGKHCFYWQIDLEMWVEQRCSGLLDSTSTTQGKRFDDIFEQDRDLEESPFDTGQPGFDEITRLLCEEAAMQGFIDSARAKYDQQFM